MDAIARLRSDGGEVLLPLTPEMRDALGLESELHLAVSAHMGVLRLGRLEPREHDLATFMERFTARYRDELAAL